MAIFKVFESSNIKPENESLRINRAQRRIDANLSLMGFVDKDTNQQIFYCPALDVTGYGENESKAIEMIKFSIAEYFKFLLSLSVKKMEDQVRLRGFAHVKNKTKEFSKSFVDIDGELQNFNAVDDTVKRFTLEAA